MYRPISNSTCYKTSLVKDNNLKIHILFTKVCCNVSFPLAPVTTR